MDSIFLKDIEIWTHIGVPEAERATPQRLVVSVEISMVLTPVSSSDDIQKGIDYAAVTRDIVMLGTTERKTVERFAQDVAATILEKFKPESVKIFVQKNPDLPLQSVTITIIRP